jgi:hypothetical protein
MHASGFLERAVRVVENRELHVEPVISAVPTQTQPVSYRPEIDGLRALAVIAVMMFHAKIALSGGYVGVDIFFVISAYLITSLIVNGLAKGYLYVRRLLGASDSAHSSRNERRDNSSTCSRLVSAPARRLRCSGMVHHGLGSHCGKYLFLAKYQRLFRKYGTNASASYLVFGR